LVRTGQTGGPDMAPFAAAVAALVHVDMQWNVAAVVLGHGRCIEMVTDGLFFLSGMIVGGLLIFVVSPERLAWCVSDLGTVWLARPDTDIGC